MLSLLASARLWRDQVTILDLITPSFPIPVVLPKSKLTISLTFHLNKKGFITFLAKGRNHTSRSTVFTWVQWTAGQAWATLFSHCCRLPITGMPPGRKTKSSGPVGEETSRFLVPGPAPPLSLFYSSYSFFGPEDWHPNGSGPLIVW